MFLLLAVNSLFVLAQEKQDSIIISKPLQIIGDVTTYSTDSYKLYPMTNNRSNFLKLDTRTGELWSIQWSIEDSSRFEWTINYRDLVRYDRDDNVLWPDPEEYVNGRFEIYPTQNIYNYLLLDKINGRVWQIQCGVNVTTYIHRIYGVLDSRRE